jgi:hypothetical protein
MRHLVVRNWNPPRNSSPEENKLLEMYCCESTGITFAEVPIGRGIYPKPRRIDGIRFPFAAGHELASYDAKSSGMFETLLSHAKRRGHSVEVIEVTRWVNQRGVFGQVIVGAWLLREAYGRLRIERVVVSGTEHRPLKRFFGQHGIRVWTPSIQRPSPRTSD